MLSALLALGSAHRAHAYPWPVMPFKQQHPIRGNFDDPRSLRGRVDDDPTNPQFFHSGVDIQVRDGTPVYAIESGAVSIISRTAISVATPWASPAAPCIFGYWHIDPSVVNGQWVGRDQLLGYVHHGAGHLHLSERRFGRYLNPLRRGGLTPYVDTTPPIIHGVFFYRSGTRAQLEPDAVSGRVDIVVDASDPPPIRPRPPWSNVALSPTRITWGGLGLFDGDWLPASAHPQTVDFRRLLTIPLGDVYAPGTIQNEANQPGDYRFWLIRGLDTSLLGDGPHSIWVTAADVRDNQTTVRVPFTVVALDEAPD